MKTGIKKVEVNCNNCNASDFEIVARGREHEYTTTTSDTFMVVRCNLCGLHYLNPRPDVSELETIYPPEYYAYHLNEKNAVVNEGNLLFRARKYVYLSRLETALARCLPEDSLKVLDIGCADGRALNWYQKIEKYKVETFGVDFDQAAVKLAVQQGHTVYHGRFESVDMPENFFDMAVATHVIEHVENPRAFMLKAFTVLKPGGILLLETPNIASADAALFRRRHWGGYHFPRHWVFYDPLSIKRLSADAGFQIERIDFHPAPAFWNWSFHSLLSENLETKNQWQRKLADDLFPPTEFQRNNWKNLCAASLYTFFDLVQKSLTGKTSNMSVRLRKPQPQ